MAIPKHRVRTELRTAEIILYSFNMALGFIFGSLFLTYGLVKPNILIMLFAVILLLSAVGCILHVETKIRRMFGDGNTAAHAVLL